MLKGTFSCLLLLLVFTFSADAYKRRKNVNWNGIGDPGEPLFLTPYIEKGDLDNARRLSSVDLSYFNQTIKSYSGYFTVDKVYNSNLFFWFFLSDNAQNKPLLLWLQGGPGSSSLFGLFIENGPFYVDANNGLQKRPYAWTDEFNMVFIDQPVGTGFSFTDNDLGYVTTEDQVGAAVLSALTQFFTLFSEFQRVPFFVTGESYGGKYVPAVASAIIKSGTPIINLQGIAIGNGAVSPETMAKGMGTLLYNHGLLDESERAVFDANATIMSQLIQAGKWEEATYLFEALMFGDDDSAPYIFNVTGCSNNYNFVQCTGPADNYTTLLSTDTFRRAVHVGAKPFNVDSRVSQHLAGDFMRPSIPNLVYILNSKRYKALIYNGNLDIVCALPLTEATLANEMSDWHDSAEYLKTEKRRLVIDNDSQIAGYVRSVGNYFYQVAIRNAGHMVPTDQPVSALTMIKRFIAGNL